MATARCVGNGVKPMSLNSTYRRVVHFFTFLVCSHFTYLNLSLCVSKMRRSPLFIYLFFGKGFGIFLSLLY